MHTLYTGMDGLSILYTYMKIYCARRRWRRDREPVINSVGWEPGGKPENFGKLPCYKRSSPPVAN